MATEPPFFIAELTVYKPSTAVFDTIRASDLGYRTSELYGNGIFVTVPSIAGTNLVGVSVDGKSWVAQNSAFNGPWNSVCYGSGTFVAVALVGTSVKAMTSPDGITWTIRASAASNDWYSVCYGNGLFVAVADSGTGNRVMTSPDGVTWTSRTSAADNSWQGVCYGNGLFVAVAWSGSGNRVMTSPDGITWTIRTSAANNNWYSVCYGNGLFVAVAWSGSGNRVMTSPDGVTWTARASAANNSWLGVCYGNGLFVAVAISGTGNRVMTSPDGVTWTSRTSAADSNWISVCYGNGLFVAVSNTGAGNSVMTSPDGITWTLSTVSPPAAEWISVVYGTAGSNVGAIRIYPPLVAQAFSVDRRVNLDPTQSPAAAAWGNLSLSCPDGEFDNYVANYNNGRRPVRILWGRKMNDAARGVDVDPLYSTLLPAFIGLQDQWFLTDTTLDVPLRDATLYLETPLQTHLYGGTGTYDGTTDLANKPKPMARGGTSGNPIRNVTPTLIDPVNLIYQYNDTAGTVVNLYEGGAQTITFSSDTTNLYSGSTASGHYRTDNSRGLFQLGSAPVHTITADVTGNFIVAGAVTTVAMIAYNLLLETLSVPAVNIGIASFAAADTSYPYVAGFYYGTNDAPTGLQVLEFLLSSFAAQLMPFRDGSLRLVVLRALPGGPTINQTFTTANGVTVVPSALPTAVAAPVWRTRVGYNHNYTVQTSDMNTAYNSAAATQGQFAAAADRYATWSSSTVQAAYANPNDLAPFGGALLKQSDAQAVANDMGVLWGVQRFQYDVTVPVDIGLGCEIGDVDSVTWPLGALRSGQLGQTVGEQSVSTDPTRTFQVLV
jgi:predicted RecA/RadA family phage recombinase